MADVGIWGTFLRRVICGFYLFFLPVRLPSKVWKLLPDLPVRGFPGIWKLPLLRLPSRDGSPSLALLSLFLPFIFCPTFFRRQWAAFLGACCPLLAIRTCFLKFAQRSNVLSMNLWGRKWSPHPIPLPSYLPPPKSFLFLLVKFWSCKGLKLHAFLYSFIKCTIGFSYNVKESMDRGVWWATVHGFAKRQTWLSNRTCIFADHSVRCFGDTPCIQAHRLGISGK